MYATFDFYQNTYGGKVAEDDFKPLAARAGSLINYYTFGRIEEVTEEIKYAQCELIDNIKNFEAQEQKNIKSESVGSYSVTYADEAKSATSLNKESQRMIIYRWLPNNLIYRGL